MDGWLANVVSRLYRSIPKCPLMDQYYDYTHQTALQFHASHHRLMQNEHVVVAELMTNVVSSCSRSIPKYHLKNHYYFHTILQII